MIFLIRHGQTDYNIEKKIQGALIDAPLNKRGIKEAEILGKVFKDHKFEAVISSPLKRAVETAKIITKNAPTDNFLPDSRFIERNFGSLEGTLSQAPDFKYYYSHKIEDGESPESLYNRISSALIDIANTYSGDVLIVAHGAIIGSYVSHQTHKDVKIKNTSCVLVDSKSGELIDYNVEINDLKKFLNEN